jgi:hypothetical protein
MADIEVDAPAEAQAETQVAVAGEAKDGKRFEVKKWNAVCAPPMLVHPSHAGPEALFANTFAPARAQPTLVMPQAVRHSCGRQNEIPVITVSYCAPCGVCIPGSLWPML